MHLKYLRTTHFIVHNGTYNRKFIDHYVVSASLRRLGMSPAVVYDDIGDISDHYSILIQFKDM